MIYGQIKEEGWLLNDQKIAFWKFYYANGNLEKEGHFMANLETNYWCFYDKDSSKKIYEQFCILSIIHSRTLPLMFSPYNQLGGGTARSMIEYASLIGSDMAFLTK